jgi:hypothetical protein
MIALNCLIARILNLALLRWVNRENWDVLDMQYFTNKSEKWLKKKGRKKKIKNQKRSDTTVTARFSRLRKFAKPAQEQNFKIFLKFL